MEAHRRSIKSNQCDRLDKVQTAVKDRLSSHENRKRKAGTLHSHVSALDPEACMGYIWENRNSFTSEKIL